MIALQLEFFIVLICFCLFFRGQKEKALGFSTSCHFITVFNEVIQLGNSNSMV